MSVEYGSSNPLLDARLEGGMLATATAGTVTSHYYNFTEDVKFNGVEFHAWSPEKGDNINLYTEYWTGAVWLRYKKFGKSWYIFPNHVDKIILFPTTPQLGVRLRVDYDSKGTSDVDFALNIFKFVDQELVDITVGQQGDEW